MFHKRTLALAAIIAATQAYSVMASPPAGLRLPETVTAYLVFPAGHEPDAQGHFEIEVYCKAHLPIEEMSVHIGHAREILFAPTAGAKIDANTLGLFHGAANQGDEHVWRLKATLTRNPVHEGEEIPASLALYVDYVFPHQAFVKAIQADSALELETKQQMIVHANQRANERWSSIVRAMPVYKHPLPRR